MYVRATDIQLKPNRQPDLMDFLESINPDLQQIQGFKRYTLVDKGEGLVTVMAFYDTPANAEAAAPKSKEIFGNLADLLAGPPTVAAYDILADRNF